MKFLEKITKKSLLISLGLGLAIVVVALQNRPKRHPANGEGTHERINPPDGLTIDPAASQYPTDASKNKKSEPLTSEELKKIDAMLVAQGAKKSEPKKTFDLGEVEAQQVYNDEFKWTREFYDDSNMGEGLMFLPLSSLRFVEKNSKRVIAQIRINESDANCSEDFSAANIDISTPWPEIIFTCTSKGSGASADVLVMSLTKDQRVLVNADFFAMPLEIIAVTDHAEVRPKQPREGFLNSAFHSSNRAIHRKNGSDIDEKKSSRVPAFYALAQKEVRGLHNCNQCTLRTFSVIELDTGVWKDANSALGAKKLFERSLSEVSKALQHFKNKKKFKEDDENFRIYSLNETLFLHVAHSIRVDRGAEAWKEMNKTFSPKHFELCNGEKECPFKTWQEEIKSELEDRGFPVAELKP